jgi:hypothetical protein
MSPKLSEKIRNQPAADIIINLKNEKSELTNRKEKTLELRRIIDSKSELKEWFSWIMLRKRKKTILIMFEMLPFKPHRVMVSLLDQLSIASYFFPSEMLI